MKFHAQKQIGKSHAIDIFTSEDMKNISLCIVQYLTLYSIINLHIYGNITAFASFIFQVNGNSLGRLTYKVLLVQFTQCYFTTEKILF